MIEPKIEESAFDRIYPKFLMGLLCLIFFAFICGSIYSIVATYNRGDKVLKVNNGDFGTVVSISNCNRDKHTRCDIKTNLYQLKHIKIVNNGVLLQVGTKLTYVEKLTTLEYTYHVCDPHFCYWRIASEAWPRDDYQKHFNRLKKR